MGRLATQAPPSALQALAARFDPEVFDVGSRRARVRLEGAGLGRWDVVLADGRATVEAADEGRNPDAVLSADAETWRSISEDLRNGMAAFRAGRLVVRRDLHLGVGFLAATSGRREAGGLVFRRVATSVGELSTMEAGHGRPVVLLHGLGATKASFLPTVAALAPHHRAIAIDLPGFGDSVKPLGAPYHAPYFAKSVVALLDALGLERADVVGNSMGGRVAIELGLRHPDRVRRLALLAPSLGGVETLILHPATTSHRSLSPDELRRSGIGEGTVRIAVGIEHPEDLWADMAQALA